MGMAEHPDAVTRNRPDEPPGMAPGPEQMKAAVNRRRVVKDSSSDTARELVAVMHAIWWEHGTKWLDWMEILIANDRQFQTVRTKMLDTINSGERTLAKAIRMIVDGQE